MMASIRNISIKLDKVTLNGVICSNPEVKILSYGSCIDPNCAYNPKTKSIEAQVTGDCIDSGEACITYYVKCKEGDCIDAVIEKCLCVDDGDCADCEFCDNGVCANKCPKDECFEGECSECTTDEQCECNQSCLGGDCGCSDPDRFINEEGCCVECDEETPCPPCFECRGGNCVPKDCGEGQCDPKDGVCKDCVTSCEGVNECCVSNTCECCQGYTRNTCTGECVAIPKNPCTFDKPCPGGCFDCSNIDPCTGYGSCVPKACPPNFVCVGGDCFPKCDCDVRDCSSQGGSSSCANHPSLQGVCYCHDCAVGNCGENSDGADCGPASDRDACICDDGNCVPNDGDGDDGGDGACSDSLIIVKDDSNCSLVGQWVSEDCCACPPITVKVTPNIDGENIDFTYTLFKGASAQEGFRLGNDEINDDIANTEEPTAGSFRVDINDDIVVNQYENGELKGSYASTVINRTDTDDMHTSNTIKDETSGTSLYPEYDDSNSVPEDFTGTKELLTGRTIEVRLDTILRFAQEEGTGCVYGERNQLLGYIPESQLNTTHEFTLTNDDCRPPYFIWRKDGVAFRKRYIDEPYVDIVSIDEGLEACKDIELEVDCGCAEPATSDSEFCNPNPPAIVTPLNNCLDEFEVTIPPACRLNVRDTTVKIDFGVSISEVSGLSSNSHIISGSIISVSPLESSREFTVKLASPSNNITSKLECC